MRMLCFVFTASLTAGGGCSKSSTPVETIPQPTLRQRIHAAVDAMPLERVLVNYRAFTGPNALTIDSPDFEYFKERIMLKYEANREAIWKMEQDSANRYRASILAPKAKALREERKAQRRQRISSKFKISFHDDSKDDGLSEG